MPLEESLTIHNAKAIAEYIANRFVEEANDNFDRKFEDNILDYEFKLNHGHMEFDDCRVANTHWKFDIDNVAEDHPIKIFQNELSELVDYSEEQEAMIASFYMDILDSLNDEYMEQIRLGIRKAVLKNQPEIITPLDHISLIDLEIGCRPIDDCVYSIQKTTPQEVLEQGGGGGSVIPELTRIREQTGKSFQEIIKEKKEENDENYKYISGINARKEMYDCYFDLFVDYSPRPLEEIQSKL